MNIQLKTRVMAAHAAVAAIGVLAALAGVPQTAAAADGLSLSDTRLIMAGGSMSAATIFTNTSSTKYLAKSEVLALDGTPAADDFIVTPPVAFCPPGKQTRFQATLIHPENYPADRESLFYFQTHAEPGNYTDKGNTLQVSYAFRIKLHYRPAGLQEDIVEASEKLVWQIRKGFLTVTNPSKLYVTIVTIGVDKAYQKLVDGILAPGETRSFKLKRTFPETVLVRWAAIDDYGAVLQLHRKVRNEK